MAGNRRQQTPSFGEVIRQRRVELGMTQEELAERVGESVRQSDISRLERDYVALPRRDRLEALAAALEVTPGYLLMHSGWITREELAFMESPDARIATPADAAEPESHPDDVCAAPEDESPTETAHRHVPAAPSSLYDAIAHARQVSSHTEELLRRTSATMQNARRTRRAPR